MKRHYNAKFSIKKERYICELYQKRVQNNCVSLSKRFGCNPSTIYNILKSHKINIRSYSKSQIGLRIDIKHPRYKGGNISPNGYKRIYAYSFGKRRLVNEHTHRIEQKLGRRITSFEIVHHKNDNKLDNRMSNLILMTRAEHCKLHNPALKS